VRAAQRGEQLVAGVGGGAGAGRAGEQPRERQRAGDLHGDEQHRVVARVRRRDRRDVEEPVDVRGQTASGDLGDEHEDRERHQPSLADERTHLIR